MWGEVYLVYLRYGTAKGEAPLVSAKRLARRWFPLSETRSVIVDNAMAADIEQQLDDTTTLVSGDNREREFSGYEKGLAWLQRTYRLAPDATVILTNDTFLSSYGGDGFLEDFTFSRVRAGLALNALVGHVDSFPEMVAWEGRPFQRWVRTSLVVAKLKTLQSLLPFSLNNSNSELFLPKGKFFSAGAPLSANYKEFIETWLFRKASDGGVFKESWHSKEPLTQASRGRMQAKARCILCEHTLSLRALEKGIPLFDPMRLSLRRAVRVSPLRLAEKVKQIFASHAPREA